MEKAALGRATSVSLLVLVFACHGDTADYGSGELALAAGDMLVADVEFINTHDRVFDGILSEEVPANWKKTGWSGNDDEGYTLGLQSKKTLTFAKLGSKPVELLGLAKDKAGKPVKGSDGETFDPSLTVFVGGDGVITVAYAVNASSDSFVEASARLPVAKGKLVLPGDKPFNLSLSGESSPWNIQGSVTLRYGGGE